MGSAIGKSTDHNLIHILNHIAESLNNGEITVGVFLDLKKAFDVCDHQILLRKLNKYGISGLPLD
jgi:ribonuclease P/MRP protein subunit RPP40